MENLINCPAVFSTQAAPKMSDRYSFVSTHQLVQGLEDLGWSVRNARQSKSRSTENRAFDKHEVRMTNGGLITVGDTAPEIVIINSHNGKAPISFDMGLFRLACENGLTVPVQGFNESLRIRHTNIESSELKELMERFAAFLPSVSDRVKRMQETRIEETDALDFFRKSVAIRWEGNVNVNFDDYIQAERTEDENPTVWNIFNIAQEKLVRGKVEMQKDGKTRKARPIKNFSLENEVNLKLWEMAESYCN